MVVTAIFGNKFVMSDSRVCIPGLRNWIWYRVDLSSATIVAVLCYE